MLMQINTSRGINLTAQDLILLQSFGSMGENAIVFGADMNSSGDIDNNGKNILILGEGPTQWLDVRH